MSLSYELTAGVLRFVTVNDVEFSDGTRTLMEGLRAAAERGGRWHLLFDIRESREQRRSDELESVATLIAAHREHLSGRCAVVVSDPLHYGLGRMFGVFMESLGLTSVVFRDTAEADRWLTG